MDRRKFREEDLGWVRYFTTIIREITIWQRDSDAITSVSGFKFFDVITNRQKISNVNDAIR
jgi:hypothetical protein